MRARDLRGIATRHVVAGLYAATMFVIFLDQTVITVALPSISRSFHVVSSSASALIVAYLLSLAIFIPVASWVGDRLGIKRTFVAALALFAAASALCGVAGSYTQLVAFRALQGVGGGLLVPTGLTMLLHSYPADRRVQVSRILTIPIAFAPMSGPLIGGLLSTDASWRWIFYANLPVAVPAVIIGVRLLHDEWPRPAKRRFDVAGFCLAASGLGLGLYALSEGPVLGWDAPAILLAAAGAVVSLIALVRVETHRANALVDLVVARERLFRVTAVTNLFAVSCLQGTLFLVPLMLQLAQGRSALAAGSTSFPEAIGALLFSQVVGRIYPRFGPKRLICAATTGLIAILAAYQFISFSANLWLFRSLMFVTGFCAVTIFISVQVAVFARITPEKLGAASSLFNVSRQVAAALGVASVATVLGSTAAGAASPGSPVVVGSFRHAFLAALCLAVVALASATRMNGADSANTWNAPRVEDRAGGGIEAAELARQDV